MLGNEFEKKIAAVSLSNSIVQRKICDMAIDIKDQVVQKINLGLFSVEPDESTEVASSYQLLVSARYLHLKRCLIFVLLLKPLPSHQRFGKKLLLSLNSKILCWDDVCGC